MISNNKQFNNCLTGFSHLINENCEQHKLSIKEMHDAIFLKELNKYYPNGKIYTLSVDNLGNTHKTLVKSIKYSGYHDAFRITTLTNDYITCTVNTKLLVSNSNEIIEKEIGEITIKDKLYVYHPDRENGYGNILLPISIISIEYIGLRHLYSIEMEDELHNCILSNGIILHN